MAEQQLAAVKEYIAKYNLEEGLSQAVNMAIKLDSEDPFRVISDYLKTLAKEQDDDEEEEDIIQEEQEMPAMKPRGRRQQVMATKFEAPSDWTPPIIEKAPEQEAFLKDVMETNKLMKNLTPSDRAQLLQAFKPVGFAEGEFIIKQGEQADVMDFYVLESGTCDISIEGKGSVMKATRGIAFGELALLHNAPRAATVKAEGAVTAFALDMISFKMILMGKSKKDTTDYVGFLKNIEILKSKSDEELRSIAGCLKEVEYSEGKNIIVEGDEGNSFYIIREGEVKCTKAGQGEVSARLTQGDFFGELALLSSDKRAATVTATKTTYVLMLGRAEFDRLLGPLSGEMAEAAAAKRASASS